jgi:hypothetical protein
MLLREEIEALAARADNQFSSEDRAVFEELKRALNRGEVRAAERGSDGKWSVNAWGQAGTAARFSHGCDHRHVRWPQL